MNPLSPSASSLSSLNNSIQTGGSAPVAAGALGTIGAPVGFAPQKPLAMPEPHTYVPSGIQPSASIQPTPQPVTNLQPTAPRLTPSFQPAQTAPLSAAIPRPSFTASAPSPAPTAMPTQIPTPAQTYTPPQMPSMSTQQPQYAQPKPTPSPTLQQPYQSQSQPYGYPSSGMASAPLQSAWQPPQQKPPTISDALAGHKKSHVFGVLIGLLLFITLGIAGLLYVYGSHLINQRSQNQPAQNATLPAPTSGFQVTESEIFEPNFDQGYTQSSAPTDADVLFEEFE